MKDGNTFNPQETLVRFGTCGNKQKLITNSETLRLLHFACNSPEIVLHPELVIT